MSVETAADLASYFDEEEWAEPAQYTAPAGGAAADCLVIVDRGQGRRVFDAGQREIAASERHLWVRLAELASVERAGTFAMLDADGNPTGEAFKVAGLPKLDQLGALWSVDLTILDP